MAPLMYFSRRKVLLLYLVLFLFTSVFFCFCSSESQLQTKQFLGRRRMLLELEKEEQQPKKKTTTSLSSKNQTKLIKPSLSSKNKTKLIQPSLSPKNQTKFIKNGLSSKNQTKLTKPLNSTKAASNVLPKILLKKVNSTLKASNLIKPTSFSSKKLSDLPKISSTKNKTTKAAAATTTSKVTQLESNKPNKNQKTDTKSNQQPKAKKRTQPSWIDQDDDQDDLVSGFTDLPTKFQRTLIPDLEKFSTTSKIYINRANKEITEGFKPIVGNKYASTIATIVSCAFIFIPFLLVSLIFNKIKAYFSLQKLLIFIQVYLSIYFTILGLSSLITGLEPLKFFYATSQSTYVCLLLLQTLGYVLFLLLLLMYLILVFSTECGLGSKFLGLAQTFVGFAVGLHYYMAVFHQMVLHQPPKTNWKIHGIYATCFLVICVLAGAERRKKSYLEEGGEEGKKS